MINIEFEELPRGVVFTDLAIGEWFLWDKNADWPQVKLSEREYGYYVGIEFCRANADPADAEVFPLDVKMTCRRRA